MGHGQNERVLPRIAWSEIIRGMTPDHTVLINRHEHIDVRFLLELDDRIPIPGNDESHEILWTPLHQACRYNRNLSTHRMIEKTRRMRHS